MGYLIHQPAKPVGHWAVFRRNPNGGIVYLDSLEDGPVCVQSEDEVLNAIQDWHSQGYIIIAVGAHQNRSLAMAAAWNVVSKRVGLGRSSSNHVRQPKQSALKQPSPGGRRRRPSSFEGLPKNTRRVSFSKMNRIHPYVLCQPMASSLQVVVFNVLFTACVPALFVYAFIIAVATHGPDHPCSLALLPCPHSSAPPPSLTTTGSISAYPSDYPVYTCRHVLSLPLQAAAAAAAATAAAAAAVAAAAAATAAGRAVTHMATGD